MIISLGGSTDERVWDSTKLELIARQQSFTDAGRSHLVENQRQMGELELAANQRFGLLSDRLAELELVEDERQRKIAKEKEQQDARSIAIAIAEVRSGPWWRRAGVKENAYRDIRSSWFTGVLLGLTLCIGLLAMLIFVVAGQDPSATCADLLSRSREIGPQRCSELLRDESRKLPKETGALLFAGISGIVASFWGWIELHCSRGKTLAGDQMSDGGIEPVLARGWDEPSRGGKTWPERELEAKNYTRGFALLALNFGIAAQAIKSGAPDWLTAVFLVVGLFMLPAAVLIADPFLFGVKTHRMPGLIGAIARNLGLSAGLLLLLLAAYGALYYFLGR